MTLPRDFRLGAQLLAQDRCAFTVWAPLAKRVEVCLGNGSSRVLRLEAGDQGYHHLVADSVAPGTRYAWRLDGGPDRPDPASRWQPAGVHAPSAVVSPAFPWTDQAWRGVSPDHLVIYELHVGTFTPAGSFAAVIPHLEALRTLGVTAVELMPVAQFPGARNWGYDGVHPFAPQHSYGGPAGLRELVNACHAHGLAVILDVVFNHLGPEGNYLAEFGPYFTDRYHTPWGLAVNVDGAGSDEVRRFFTECALDWVRDYHVDGLRLDAVHGIVDTSALPFLEELADAVHRVPREGRQRVLVIAESDLNDPKVVRPREAGGWDMDAQWSDDFHHALHAQLTGERAGYYADFGGLEALAQAFRDAYVLQGQPSRFRGRRHGRSTAGVPGNHFVVYAQSHDQVGNRMKGERLANLVDFDSLKLAAACVLLSPFIPQVFMGEEHGEERPFLYFTSHGDAALVESVRAGRRREFAHFQWDAEPPDPQDPATFQRCILGTEAEWTPTQRLLRAWYAELLRLRATLPGLRPLERGAVECRVLEAQEVLLVHRGHGAERVTALFNFADQPALVPLELEPGARMVVLDSSLPRWGGAGLPAAATLGGTPGTAVSVGRRGVVVLARGRA